MQLLLLHLDDALELQPEFMRSCKMAGAHELNEQQSGRAVRLWGRQAALDTLWRKLTQAGRQGSAEPRLCFMGSGDFHHVTSLLIDQALENRSERVTVIHIDNHPDWVHFDGGMHCGSWVNRTLANPQVDKVITIGVCSNDLETPERKGANLDLLASGRLELYPYMHPPSRVKASYGAGQSYRQHDRDLYWQTIAEIGEMNFIDRLLAGIETECVYITLDKDVLVQGDAVTNWDQGRMQMPYVLSIISAIGERYRIIGADVTGDYSRPDYSGTLWTRMLKKGEILIDQPRHTCSGPQICTINSAANLALLDVFGEQMR
ncbi:arginase [Agrobacterium vitis]|uniref:arginase n=1 Tax=Agrobacterium vitis TaxID=373 RepID=UPI0013215DBF|nr:arginase [Agrobacterium vitis]